MENNNGTHNNKIRILLVFLMLIISTSYVTAHIYEQFADYKNYNELVFAITKKNTVFTEDSIEKPWYLDFYNSVKGFFSPTKTLVPVLVIFPEDSENNEMSSGNPQGIEQTGKNDTIAETSRDNKYGIDALDRNNPKAIDEKSNSTANSSVSGSGSSNSGKQWDVSANDPEISYGEKGNTAKADIFSNSKDFYNKKIIYPGISGKYNFTVDNTKNDYNIVYNIIFAEEGLNTIPIEYRLKTADGYLGEAGRWYYIDELNTLVKPSPMEKKDKLNYILEWKWQEGNNDNQYLQYSGEEYTLKITVRAEAR